MTFRQKSSAVPVETLEQALQRAGFYPALISDVLRDSLNGQACLAHLVHLETHFDRNEVHRHITALALTETALVIAHVDDQCMDDTGAQMMAQISTEVIPVAQIRSVVLSYIYAQPQDYQPADSALELTLSLGWSGSQRFDLVPVSCADPQCEAEHGFSGTVAQEDIALRISAEADGPLAVTEAQRFARILRERNGRTAGQSEPTRLSSAPSVNSRLGRNHHR
ncbi:DUF5998 family protein [Acaricomes phytoseiuli]|uniref:DUF5998 family protein n=1 Tax=Acaricomes phytoseiuli TaxID=291968 RepID=UPI0003A16EDF|nr:DUF5998 family protein [Acaricomes phytoseiuli]MCW1249120.1 DUF5998 family protein [Acaricomes phytoseiuli]